MAASNDATDVTNTMSHSLSFPWRHLMLHRCIAMATRCCVMSEPHLRCRKKAEAGGRRRWKQIRIFPSGPIGLRAQSLWMGEEITPPPSFAVQGPGLSGQIGNPPLTVHIC
ncbi:hypothetical protein FKM82_025262 [Ascaphus truei]